MITPVHIDIKDSQSSMRFEIPADYTRYNLPKPNESFIIFKPRMENIAGIRFGSYANDEEVKKNAAM